MPHIRKNYDKPIIPVSSIKMDRVNHPAYYQDPSGVECITITRHRDFNIGNAIKYLWRAGLKNEEGMSTTAKQIEDLEKAIFYIKDEIRLLGNLMDNGKHKTEF